MKTVAGTVTDFAQKKPTDSVFYLYDTDPSAEWRSVTKWF